MKKIITILLSMCMLLCLLGCQRNVATDTQPPTDDTVAQNTPAVILGVPFTAVSVPTVTDEVKAEDGTVIFTKGHQDISMTLSGQAAADQIVLDFLNRIDAGCANADSILTAAKSAYASKGSSDNWIPYSCSIRFEPTRIDQAVLSLFGNNISYTGGSHPDYRCVAINYNLITGEALSLGSILTGVDGVDQLRKLVLSDLETQKQEKYLREGYEETVNQRFAGEESHDYNWYFSDEGICFYFAPYEIAPYSSGVIVAQVPYEQLVGIITDEFFPPERQNLSGTMEFVSFDSNNNQYEHISELILDNGGQMHALQTDSCVQDIRIIVTDPLTYEDHTVYAALYLNPQEAIVIQSNDTQLRNMHVEYQSNGETVSLPLA